MKTTRYLIEKRTTISISYEGKLIEDICYLIYKRAWFRWVRIKHNKLVKSYGVSEKFSISFDNPEQAEEYIKSFHANKKRVGRVEIKTEKIIEL